MVKLRSCVQVCVDGMRRWPSIPRVWVVALSCAFLYSQLCLPLARLARAQETPLNLFEPFIAIGSTLPRLAVLLAGYLLILSDAPFFHPSEINALYRTGKTVWFAGKLLYLFVTTTLYLLLILLFTVVTVSGYAFHANVWSTLGELSASSNISIEEHLGMSLDAQVIASMLPWQAMVHTFLLLWLYCCFSALVMLLINMRHQQVFGYVGAAALYVLGFLAQSGDFPLLYWLSPLQNAMLASHDFGYQRVSMPTLCQSYALLSGGGLLLVALAFLRIRSYGFSFSKRLSKYE